MNLVVKSLRDDDVDLILQMEKKSLLDSGMDEISADMESWKSRWRQEALMHYIPKGWSFGVKEEFTGEIQAYFIAKVIPFFRSYTQVLWIERFHSSNSLAREQLLEVAYKYAREKHLQMILFDGFQLNSQESELYKSFPVEVNWTGIKTAKNKD